MINKTFTLAALLISTLLWSCEERTQPTRSSTLLNEGWRFFKYENAAVADSLIYDVRPEVKDANDVKDADTKPTEAVEVKAQQFVMKPWIMPSGNDFLGNGKPKHERPAGNPGADFPFVQTEFDDSQWQSLDLPHDWAITGPFYEGWGTPVGGGMGRLPIQGVAWYRKQIQIPSEDQGKSIYLDIDGAMSYAMVWVNGQIAGGWPYGYSSFRIDMTPYLNYGGINQIAIRIDNPPNSSRWYPGAGIYRNVWLTKTNAVHVAHWGTFVKTSEVSSASAKIALDVTVSNDNDSQSEAIISTIIYEKGSNQPVGTFADQKLSIAANSKATTSASIMLATPKLWGPPPSQTPNLYTAVSAIFIEGEKVDEYKTDFGIRSIIFDAEKGLIVNGEPIELKGVNQHHDLGALGGAFNVRAAERQLEILKEMGCNAIRLAHNPPAPELLALTDSMGFLVVDELYDCWERKKTPLDFHLIFPEWHEQDLRALIRRDKNHPSVIMWSTGNEVGEQYTDAAGAALARKLRVIANDEDPSRPTTASMNYAKPHMPLPSELEVISLNYQGEGIRNAPAYAHLKGINTAPLYPDFHQTFPNKVIISSENAAALSSRGTYIFPVTKGISAPVSDSTGGDPENLYVSAYELYTAPFGSSADKVLSSLKKHPYVAGGFVWSGWDYIGEPTPYYLSRSSYYGVIDLAGFKKDRFYLYQAAWRPDLPMAHLLPHWNWPDRIGKITPIHAFTTGDEAELFLNGKSQGRRQKGMYDFRLRWDDVVYEPGEITIVAYKNGKKWTEETIKTTGEANKIVLEADRSTIKANGFDLSFVTIKVTDENGLTVPDAMNNIKVSLEGAGEVVATDNGDPSCLIPFPETEKPAFNGLLLAIVKSEKGKSGTLKLTASAEGLAPATISIETIK